MVGPRQVWRMERWRLWSWNWDVQTTTLAACPQASQPHLSTATAMATQEGLPRARFAPPYDQWLG